MKQTLVAIGAIAVLAFTMGVKPGVRAGTAYAAIDADALRRKRWSL